MKAPKKIWWSEGSQLATKMEIGSVVPYIRADIVDELVKALKDIRDYEFSHRYIKDITKAALAKLEQEE